MPEKVEIIIKPKITVSPVIKTTFYISVKPIIKILESLVKVIKHGV